MSITSTTGTPKVTIKRVAISDPTIIAEVPNTSLKQLHKKDPTTNHVTSAEIHFSTTKWPTTDSSAQIVAHEFGHVVGLAHAGTSDQIMYGTPSGGQLVKAADVKGMKALTHGCATGGHDLSYSNMGTFSHKETCSVCGANGVVDHTHTSFVQFSVTQHSAKCTKCAHTSYLNHSWGSDNKCIQCKRVKP